MPQNQSSKNKETALGGVFWLWVGAAATAYLMQFKVFVDPILSLLGLS
ncbi:MAG: hypothetical protein O3A85_02490 [Proteobacteria bacterium]|nr:hypothetical protein [Pseudomonadota bacterium]